MENQQTQQELPKLKPKEELFVKKLVLENNENATETVKEVYGIEDDNYARLKGHRLITKDNISQAIETEKETLKSALVKQGITPERIAEKIDVLLEAKKPVYEKNEDGQFENVGDEIDFTAVDKGLKHATNIYGVENLEDKPKVQNNYNFFFNPEIQEKVKIMEDEIKSILVQKNAK